MLLDLGLPDMGGLELLKQMRSRKLAVPAIHKDSFDRLLIAQARVEDIVLLTDDATIAQYQGPIRLA